MHPQSRTASRSSRRTADEDLFERKSRELVAPEDEIEAWELDAQDLGDIVKGADAVVFAAGAGPGSGPERKRTVDYGGAVKRLNNLGYRCAPDTRELTEELQDVLLRFQHDNKLKTSRELDQATQDKLKEKHGC